MTDTTLENTIDFEVLDKVLSDSIDNEITGELDYYLDIVRQKSRALASSLKRCFSNARKSKRYILVYQLGTEEGNKENTLDMSLRGASPKRGDEAIPIESLQDNSGLLRSLTLPRNDIEKHLEEYLKEYFEKNDFMHYREFVRLNRACAIDVGGEVSSQIKNMYNEFFFGKRLVMAYDLGYKKKLQLTEH